jgi:hypothetical protein
MFRHHVDPNGHFYLNSMGNMSDADSLQVSSGVSLKDERLDYALPIGVAAV